MDVRRARSRDNRRAGGGRMTRVFVRAALALLLVSVGVGALAQSCFWSHVDHEWSYDASGVWNPSTYRDLVTALTIGQVAGALWEGADSRFGKTMWQGMDSEI